MKEIKCDDVNKKRVEKIMDEVYGPERIKLKRELTLQFATRVGELLGQGITPGMAVTAAIKHYRDCAELMLEICNDKVLMSEVDTLVPRSELNRRG